MKLEREWFKYYKERYRHVMWYQMEPDSLGRGLLLLRQ